LIFDNRWYLVSLRGNGAITIGLVRNSRQLDAPTLDLRKMTITLADFAGNDPQIQATALPQPPLSS